MISIRDILTKFRSILQVDAKFVYTKLGIRQTRYSNWETGENKDAKADFYNLFKEAFGIDLYLSRQEDKFVIVDPRKLSFPQFKLLIDNGAVSEWLPVYNIDVSGGMLQFYRDETDITADFVVSKGLYKESLFGVPVLGDSMDPVICNGDYIICKEIMDFKDIISGHIYLLCLVNGIDTVKTVHVHKEEKGLLMLVPANPGFPVKLARQEEIFKIFKITGFIRADEVLNKLAIL